VAVGAGIGSIRRGSVGFRFLGSASELGHLRRLLALEGFELAPAMSVYRRPDRLDRR
jgi:hypothetical protein